MLPMTTTAPLKRYRLLVFDWDGTLIDSEAKIVATVHAVVDELGLPRVPGERIRNVIGLALPEAMAELFAVCSPDLRRHIVERYRYHFSHPKSPVSKLFSGAMMTLAHLRRAGYILCLATSKSREGLQQELELTDLGDYFTATRCADETRSKPDPLMLNQIMVQVGAKPRETLVIGDSDYDMAMARNAGTDAVALTCGAHSRERLLAWFPRACLDSILDIPHWLDGIGRTCVRS